ncbi:DUF4286 family protein [Salinibacter altiplanensis]|uniref:DUF4286 family protein n=1 Tax=Salinibacter altiplanensis TaxID=1803181 RepID=UPI000C9EF90A|nr:DUF4286 family protein [Salinibacter altiplanensis]
MLIYEVTLAVDGEAAPRYSSWLREHIREMLGLDGFEAAVWYATSDDGEEAPPPDEPTGDRTWTVQYQVRDRDALQAYFDEHADDLREAGPEHGDHVTADRRILEQKRLFQG